MGASTETTEYTYVTASVITANDDLGMSNYTIYRNPTTGLVNINFGDLENVSIKVFTETGFLVYKKTGISAVQQFEFKGAPGSYFIEVSSEDDSQILKLIKIKLHK